jgi:hypothetical protein
VWTCKLCSLHSKSRNCTSILGIEKIDRLEQSQHFTVAF